MPGSAGINLKNIIIYINKELVKILAKTCLFVGDWQLGSRSKVCKFDMAMFVNENIIRLNISVKTKKLIWLYNLLSVYVYVY